MRSVEKNTKNKWNKITLLSAVPWDHANPIPAILFVPLELTLYMQPVHYQQTGLEPRSPPLTAVQVSICNFIQMMWRASWTMTHANKALSHWSTSTHCGFWVWSVGLELSRTAANRFEMFSVSPRNERSCESGSANQQREHFWTHFLVVTPATVARNSATLAPKKVTKPVAYSIMRKEFVGKHCTYVKCSKPAICQIRTK